MCVKRTSFSSTTNTQQLFASGSRASSLYYYFECASAQVDQPVSEEQHGKIHGTSSTQGCIPSAHLTSHSPTSQTQTFQPYKSSHSLILPTTSRNPSHKPSATKTTTQTPLLNPTQHQNPLSRTHATQTEVGKRVSLQQSTPR